LCLKNLALLWRKEMKKKFLNLLLPPASCLLPPSLHGKTFSANPNYLICFNICGMWVLNKNRSKKKPPTPVKNNNKRSGFTKNLNLKILPTEKKNRYSQSKN
jgi:hypothetical protein